MEYQLLSIIIACLTTILAAISSSEARKSSKESASTALQLSNQQNYVQKNELKLQYHNEVRCWASECIMTIGEILALCDIKSGTANHKEEEKLKLIYRISSLLDSGRWFFPNDRSVRTGLHNPEAFQGDRHKVLNNLFGVYKYGLKIEINEASDNEKVKREIWSRRRNFTNLIQQYVQTNDWTEVINEIDSLTS